MSHLYFDLGMYNCAVLEKEFTTVAELGLTVEGSSLLCRYCSFSPFFFFLFPFFIAPAMSPLGHDATSHGHGDS